MKGKNNWRDKREVQHDSHNRKPGRGKFWKHLGARKSRRFSNMFRFHQAKEWE